MWPNGLQTDDGRQSLMAVWACVLQPDRLPATSIRDRKMASLCPDFLKNGRRAMEVSVEFIIFILIGLTRQM